RRLASAQARLATAQAAASKIATAVAQARQRWVALWEDAGITPLDPPKMLDWLRSAESLRRLRQEQEKMQRRAEIVRADRERFEGRVRAGMGGGGMFPELLLADARERVEESAKVHLRRQQFEQELQRQRR